MKTTVTLLSACALSSASAAVFSSGELDFGVILENNALEIEAHVVSGIVDGNQTTDVEMETEDLQVLAGMDRRFAAPAGFAAAGVSQGESLWILPQSEVAGVPYVALASEELTAADWSSSITFTLGSVTSPSGNGTFSMWESGSVGGQTFHFSSTNAGATANNNSYVSNFSHNHVNWGFSEPGEWTVELQAAGTHSTLGMLQTSSNLRFSVVPEPSSALLFGISILGVFGRRRKG